MSVGRAVREPICDFDMPQIYVHRRSYNGGAHGAVPLAELPLMQENPDLANSALIQDPKFPT